MKISRPLVIGALAMSFPDSGAMAGMIPESWDANGDGQVTRSEWNVAFDSHNVFNRIDDNNSGIFEIEESDENFVRYNTDFDYDEDFHIERDELENGLFRMYDKNDNERLSESEFADFSAKLQNLDA